MSIGTYAQFTSISPASIIDARPAGISPHKFILNWSYPQDNYVVSKVEIFRYITDRITGETTFDFSNQNYRIATITANAANITSFVDDLSQFYTPSSNTLKNLYNGGNSVVSDQQLLDEVYYSRRGIIYGIRTSKSGATDVTISTTISAGGFDTQPYVLISHDSSGKLQCVSTKNQVKHNIFHFEGEDIWTTQLRTLSGSIPGSIGAVAVDLDRLYLEQSLHGGVSGVGGWGWVTSRKAAQGNNTIGDQFAYRCSLRNGALDSVFNIHAPYNSTYTGKYNGLCVDAKSGLAVVGTYTPPISGGGLYQTITENIPGNYTALNTNCVNYPNTFACRDMCSPPANSNVYWAINNDHFMRIISSGAGTWTATLCGVSDTFACVTNGPDGVVFASTAAGSRNRLYYLPSILSPSVQTLQLDRSNESDRACCADNDLLYPNNQPNDLNGYSVWVANPELKYVFRAFYSKTSQQLNMIYNDIVTNLHLPISAVGIGKEVYGSIPAVGISVDSENNVWAVGNNSSGYTLTKLYRLLDSNLYPYGGRCRYPSVAISSWPNSLTNSKEVEWFLTRDPSLMTPSVATLWGSLTASANQTLNSTNGAATQLSGITVLGATISQQIANVYSFINSIGIESSTLSGRLVYPHYTGFDIPYKMQTDSTGYKGTVNGCRNGMTGDLKTGYYIANANTNNEIFNDYIYPSTTPPSVKVSFANANQNSPIYEPNGRPWQSITSDIISGMVFPSYINMGGHHLPNHELHTNVTGYDDLTMDIIISANPGSFILTGMMIDCMMNLGNVYSFQSDIITIRNINQNYRQDGVYATSAAIPFSFNQPSQVGTPLQPYSNWGTWQALWDTQRSYFINYAGVMTSPDPYTLNNMANTAFAPFPAITDVLYTTITERWPTPSFLISPDVPQNAWKGYNGNSNTAYASAPISINLWDTTIARTFPISSWTISASASTALTNSISTNWTSVATTLWSYVTTFNFQPNDYTRLPADTINSVSRGNSSIFPFLSGFYNPGLYGFSLSVRGQSNTQGASADGAIYTFTQYLCVDGIPPTSNWGVISAITVPSNYSNSITLPASSQLINTTIDNIITGYAPNLTIWFADSSSPGTFQIQNYTWDFGDYYDTSYNNVSLASQTTAKHVYTMPGMYNVKYCVNPVDSFAPSCCARSTTPSTDFYIWVSEIPPVADFTIGTILFSEFNISLSGVSPFTVYANPSSIHTGSFSIGRIDYDFGDGSKIETVTRYPASITTNNGTAIYNSNAYPGDFNDPRNYIVPHQYVIDTPHTYNISLTSYASNTNTASVCALNSSIVVDTGTINSSTAKRHLVKSRFMNNNDDMIYVFEDGSQNTSYTVVLSGD